MNCPERVPWVELKGAMLLNLGEFGYGLNAFQVIHELPCTFREHEKSSSLRILMKAP